jgi:hypothetical protein
VFKIYWGILRIDGKINLVGGCLSGCLGVIINGGRLGWGWIINGRSEVEINILKWIKF